MARDYAKTPHCPRDCVISCLSLKCRIDESEDKDKLTLFRGEFTISLERARKGTFYKYVVVKRGKVHWEQLPEFPPKFGYSSIVNRSLRIPDKHIEQGGK